MASIDTEQLQALLVILSAAGVTRFKCSAYELELPQRQPQPPKATPRDAATPDDYTRLLGGQRPTFGGQA